jgi:ribonuclease-3
MRAITKLPPPTENRFNNAARPMTVSDVSAILSRYLSGADAVPGDAALFQRALVHRSYAVGPSPEKLGRANARCPADTMPLQAHSYERLEFLGDAVLSLLTATYLYERYPCEDEGFLSRMRTRLINGRSLADLCARTPLPGFVVADTVATAAASNTLEDVFEAFLGAIYIDRGIDAARRWLVGLYEDHIDFAELVANQDTAKSVLNRHCMRHHGFVPQLEDLSSGDSSAVRLRHPTSGAVISTGYGPCRRDAEDQAVRRAIKYYNIPHRGRAP